MLPAPKSNKSDNSSVAASTNSTSQSKIGTTKPTVDKSDYDSDEDTESDSSVHNSDDSTKFDSNTRENTNLDSNFNDSKLTSELLSYLPLKNKSTNLNLDDKVDTEQEVEKSISSNTNSKDKARPLVAGYYSSESEDSDTADAVAKESELSTKLSIDSLVKKPTNMNAKVGDKKPVDFFNLNSKQPIFNDQPDHKKNTSADILASITRPIVVEHNIGQPTPTHNQDTSKIELVNVHQKSESTDSKIDTDNAAIRRLMGKKTSANIQIVEVKQQDLCMKDIDKIKQLTSEQVNYSGEKIVGIAKSKNHISYLAQQARQNDALLKSRWSEESKKRKRTFQKYGF